MVAKAGAITKLMENLAPPAWAQDWDNSGWQVGDPDAPVQRVLLALDPTAEVVEEAINRQAQLIICHHPLFMKGFKTVLNTDAQGRMIFNLIRHGIGVYAAHTNLDSASGGVNDVLAAALGLQEVDILLPQYGQLFKLVVFVPGDHADAVREALGQAGAGWIGNYSHCTFNLAGTGTFYPREGAQPYLGSVGKLEQVEETRIETIVPGEKVGRVVQAMLRAHPYEEVAYDLYPLENKGAPRGLGRVGLLPGVTSLAQLAVIVKEALQAQEVRYGGHPENQVQKVAVCGGSGGDLWPMAIKKGASVLITGDVRYHAARDMQAAGLSFIDAGHFATEKLVLAPLGEKLARAVRELDLDVEIMIAQREYNPWVCI